MLWKELFFQASGQGPQHWVVGLRNGFYTPSPSWLDALQKPLRPPHDWPHHLGAGVGGGGSSLPVRKLLKRITRSV